MSSPAEIGIGMLGYAFMGKAHAHAFRTLATTAGPPPLQPRLVAIAGRNRDAVSDAAERHGFEHAVTDWRQLIENPDIQVLDNCGPNNLHAEPTIAAAAAGKHVICEKPLGRTADEAHEIWQRVEAAGVVHMCAFNYRFVPAVRLAKELIDAGELGEIRHFRGSYLQDWGDTSDTGWRFDRQAAGSGALGDLAAHVIDLAHYLIGEITAVAGSSRTFVQGRQVDDAVAAVVDFENDAIGTIEASRVAPGRKNAFTWEINGTRGSLAFDLERLNELHISEGDGGFRTILVTEPHHPFIHHWWPPGHTLGWEHTFIHELGHFLAAIAGHHSIAPHGATFEDGYRAAEVCDAIKDSAETGSRTAIAYRNATVTTP